jgi:Leucine-rich repeat (LRR) protein
MKKSCFLILTLFLFSTVQAQGITISDANFKAKLLEANDNSYIAIGINGEKIKIDTNNDNEIQLNEALNVFELNINFFNISDLKGIENFTNLKVLQCVGNLLKTLDTSGLNNLKALYCSNNQILNLNVLASENLEVLQCHSNPLADLNVSGLKKLITLDCVYSNLINLNLSGLSNLETLNCNNNQLTNLNVTGAVNLKYLKCDYNKLDNINVLECINLETLICDKNEITNLNLDGLEKMGTLVCSDNQLTNISVIGLTNLYYLKCINNQLKRLDLSPLTGLVYLYCGNNILESLDLTGVSKLLYLHCENNQLINLDLSSVTYMYDLFCAHNKLISINLKNGSSDSQLLFGDNPDLKFICVDESQVEYITFLIKTFNQTNCVVNSYCSFTPGGTFYTLKGKTIMDSNNNGCDSSDLSYSNLNFSITNGVNKGNLISNKSGNYSLPVGEGTHIITPILENQNYFSVSPTSFNVTFPTQASPFTQDFCITPNGMHPDLEVILLPIIPARPGFDATYKIIYKNKGTNVQSGTVNLSFNDAVLDYISAVPTINNQTTDKLSWDYSNLQPLETREILVILNVNSPMEAPAVNNGDRLSFNALINPVNGDGKPVDNSFALRQSVVGSFDPNDKTCLEGDVITPSLIGEYVHYLIRFENTGTYSAQNIVVKDLIDLTKFDISTLVPTKASHDFITKISDGNKVEFIFENINLPFDNATNDGYIAFKIKTLPTLLVGDSFANEANIYFDYNFPILTNKATSTFKTLGISDFEFADYFNVYPNPVNNILNIDVKNTIEIESMAVYDVLGQLVIAVPNAKNISKIDVSKLTTGNYFLKMNTNKGTSSTKIIKN